MSQWIDRVRGHGVWLQLEALGPAIDAAFSREGNEGEAPLALGRLKTVLAFVGQRLTAIDSDLVQPGPLENISSALANATAEVGNYVSNGNVTHLLSANAHADNALTHLAQLNFVSNAEDLAALRSASDAYRAGIELQLQRVRAASDAAMASIAPLASRIAELTNDISAEKQRLSALVAEFQSQFSSAQESRAREHAADQKQRQDAVAVLLSEYAQRLADQNAEFSRMRDQVSAAHADDVRRLHSQYAEQAEATLAVITKKREDVEKLVGVIGALGVTSGYQKAADEARITSWVWQVITVGAMGGLIWVAVTSFLPIATGEFSWSSFAGRVYVSLTFGVLAAYAGRQADKYQERERRNRKLALELQALEPYLAPLSPENQEQFRLTVGERSFGNSENAETLAEKSPASVVDLVLHSKELRELVVDLLKAKR